MPISEIKDLTFGEKCESNKSIEDTCVLNLPCTLGFISDITVNTNLRKINPSTFAKNAFENLSFKEKLISHYIFGQAFV